MNKQGLLLILAVSAPLAQAEAVTVKGKNEIKLEDILVGEV